VAAYGAYAHEALLKEILGKPNLKLKMTLHPFPLSKFEQGVVAAALGSAVAILFAIAYMMVSDSLV
jgi:hypothetical protein